jgi:hypothetical protein
MNIVEYFDIVNRDHLMGYLHLLDSGSFPIEFTREVVEYSDNWFNKISQKIAMSYCKEKLSSYLITGIEKEISDEVISSILNFNENLLILELNKRLRVGWVVEDLYNRLTVTKLVDGSIEYKLDGESILIFKKPIFVRNEDSISVIIKHTKKLTFKEGK